MMMQGMGAGMYWGLVLGVFLLLGFAYIVWILASKEQGGIKVIGQIIAAVIAVLAVLILILSSFYGPGIGRHGGQTGQGGMMQQQMMREMMRDQDFQKMRMESPK